MRKLNLFAMTLILASTVLSAAPNKKPQVKLREKSDPPGPHKQFVCEPQKLIPDDPSKGKKLILDLDKAPNNIAYASTTNSYNFPDSDFQAILTLKYVPAENKKGEAPKPASIQLNKAYQQRSGKSWNFLAGIFSPTIIAPVPEDNTVYTLNLGETSGTIPAFKVECSLQINEIEVNCADCAKPKAL